MNTENKVRKLKINDRSNWHLHRSTSLVFPILFMIWGCSLVFALMYKNLTSPIFFIPVCFFSAGLIIYGVGIIYKVKHVENLISEEFHPKEKAKEIAISTMTFAPLLISFSLLFLLASLINIFFGILGLIFFLAFSYNIYLNFKEMANFYRLAKKFDRSRIIQEPSNPKIGEPISVRFFNDVLAQQGLEITATLLNLSEKLIRNGSKEKNSTLTTFVRYEETHTFIFKESGKVINFFLDSNGTFPTRLGYEPEYWELQFKEEESGFFARFVLAVEKE